MEETAITQEIKAPQVYPMVEELVIRATINSEEHGMELLKCIQTVVNSVGADQIISAVRAIEKNPSILTKAQTMLPYLQKLL